MIAKNDFLVESKHADVSLVRDNDFYMAWFDTPIRGKALSIEYIPENRPSLIASVTSNLAARREGNKCQKLGFSKMII